MQPEISRRCSACGAAVRPNATFCHQCGKPASRSGPDGGGLNGEGVEESRPAGADVGPERTHGVVAAPVAGGDPAPGAGASSGKDAGSPVVAVEERAPSGPPVDEAERDSTTTARARLHRARAVARGAVEDKLAPRVEKIRQTSSVVLDEAADDPSLRFLLIAVVLFILFLVLLFITRLLE